MNQDDLETARRLAALSTAGGFSGLLALLATSEVLTARKIIGRAGSSACMGAAASSIWIPYPSATFISALGISFFLGSIGAQVLEKSINRYLARRFKENDE